MATKGQLIVAAEIALAVHIFSPGVPHAEMIGVLTLESPADEMALAAPAASDSDIVVAPSVTTSTVGAGIKTIPISAACRDAQTGAIVPNCNVQLSLRAIPFSGGHDHDDTNRPRGVVTPAAGNTGAGVLTVTYTAPEVSGLIEVTLTGTDANGNPITPAQATFGVGIKGLVTLPPGTDYVLIGSFGEPGVASRHVGNHVGTPSVIASLRILATLYSILFPGQLLQYNDMSLVWGGLFDVGNAWSPSPLGHFTHRFGTDADVRVTDQTVPVQNRTLLRLLIRLAGFPGVVEETARRHWHLIQ